MAELLWYGGLTGAGLSLVLLTILLPIFRKRRKRLLKEIEEGEW